MYCINLATTPFKTRAQFINKKTHSGLSEFNLLYILIYGIIINVIETKNYIQLCWKILLRVVHIITKSL